MKGFKKKKKVYQLVQISKNYQVEEQSRHEI
jgi:hypothetical protein